MESWGTPYHLSTLKLDPLCFFLFDCLILPVTGMDFHIKHG